MWINIYQANTNQKKVGVAILIKEKVGIRVKTVPRDNEGHFIVIKLSIQDNITILYMYTPGNVFTGVYIYA